MVEKGSGGRDIVPDVVAIVHLLPPSLSLAAQLVEDDD